MDYLLEIQNPCICPRKEVRKGIIIVDYLLQTQSFFVNLHRDLLIHSILSLWFLVFTETICLTLISQTLFLHYKFAALYVCFLFNLENSSYITFYLCVTDFPQCMSPSLRPPAS